MALLRYFWRDRQQLKKTKNWHATKGRITQFLWTQEGHRLWPKIQYSYRVYEQDYQGEHLFLDSSHNSPNSKYARHLAYRAAMAYEKDEEVDVFYNPDNPNEAVLDTTMPRKLNLIIVLLTFLILLHLLIVFYRLL
ncbi:DUF3592 domain-containing protein [Legionella jordanis]|nr:DUF3592 domain-containing protein [Legionella jordanis]RMX01626.1 DUF3592 domain-containing protein [Legionella jordanis]RMX21780.1 DUF3592 domain-containing protein [Legionella jordanis]HAT8714504.1 DUF3592 domain-containing protein [Legionella jordanis]